MKLADDALLMLVEIFRRGILEMGDVSQAMRDLDLIEDSEGKLTLKHKGWDTVSDTD
jgi:hypothetical protein